MRLATEWNLDETNYDMKLAAVYKFKFWLEVGWSSRTWDWWWLKIKEVNYNVKLVTESIADKTNFDVKLKWIKNVKLDTNITA